MTVELLMARLSELGSERVREISHRNGADSNQFGVKLGDLRVIAKELKIQPVLAAELWQTGNLDAMLLSILICKPKTFSASELDQMADLITSPQLSDWFSGYVLKLNPHHPELRTRWLVESTSVHKRRLAWSLTADLAKSGELDGSVLLDEIETTMQSQPELVQWTMNMCLAYIGIHQPQYRKRALEIGEKLGIFRDYPTAKGCTSPFAPIWINEMVRRES